MSRHTYAYKVVWARGRKEQPGYKEDETYRASTEAQAICMAYEKAKSAAHSWVVREDCCCGRKPIIIAAFDTVSGFELS